MEDGKPGLVLRLLDYERRPDAPVDCLEFAAEASAGSFHGRTTFSVYRRDLEAFLDALDAMATSLTGAASLRCGWGKRLHFGFRAAYVGRLRRIAVALEIADPGPEDEMQRLLVNLRTEPELLRQFAAGLHRMAEDRDTASVHLEGIIA